MSLAHFQVVTLFPKLIESIFLEGVVAGACKKQLLKISCINPRQFSQDVHHTVDDRPFGGGDGMIGLAEPFYESVLLAQKNEPETEVIFLSPQGEKLTDQLVRTIAQRPNLTLVCGRYGGVDQRFLSKTKAREVSIGDYVLSGGELAAGVMIDAISRHIPGVLGHQNSADLESFAGGRLEAPQFTRPREWQGFFVPDVLCSGDHKKIQEWRELCSYLVTLKKRPDLFKNFPLSKKQKDQLLVFYKNLSEKERQTLDLGSLALTDLESLHAE